MNTQNIDNIILDDTIDTIQKAFRNNRRGQIKILGKVYTRNVEKMSRSLKNFLSNPEVYDPIIFKTFQSNLETENIIGEMKPNFKKIYSSLSNSNFLKPFNALNNGNNLKTFFSFKENKAIVFFTDENKYRSVMNENADIVTFENIPTTASSIINNNYYADFEVLKIDYLDETKNNLETLQSLDDSWIEISEPERAFVKGVPVEIETELEIYYSKFRNRYAVLVDSFFYTIVNEQDGEPATESTIFRNSIPESEPSDDWIEYGLGLYTDKTIENSKKSVITTNINLFGGITIPVSTNGISADLSLLHYKLCQNLEQYRGWFQSSPGFNNENEFFGNNRNERFRQVINSSWEEKNAFFRENLGNSPSNPYATIGEAFRFLDKGRFFIFYDFIVDVYLVRIDVKKLSELTVDSYFFDDSNCWRILRMKNREYRPVQERDILQMIQEGKNIWDECSIYKVYEPGNPVDKIFLQDGDKKLEYRPEPSSRRSPFVQNYSYLFVPSQRMIVFNNIKPPIEGYDFKVYNLLCNYFEYYMVKDELVSIFDGSDMYAWEKLENANSSKYSINKYKGQLLTNKVLNCNIYRKKPDTGFSYISNVKPFLYNPTLITKKYTFNTSKNCFQLQVENLLHLKNIREFVVDHFVNNYWNRNQDFRSHILDAIMFESWTAFTNSNERPLAQGIVGDYYYRHYEERLGRAEIDKQLEPHGKTDFRMTGIATKGGLS